MDKRYNDIDIRNSEFLPQEHIFKSDEQKVLEKISDSSRQDYEKIIKREKIRKFFRTTFVIIMLFVTLAIAGIITYLYYLNKSKEEYIARQSGKILDLQSRISFIREQEEEQVRRLENYQNLLRQRLPTIEERNMTSEVHSNLMELNSKIGNIYAENILRGNVSFKEIALTFDLASGEDCAYLYQIVKELGIRVTIFISNENPDYNSGSLLKKRNIEWIKKFAALGEQVEFGNHTWSHYNLVGSVTETSLKKRFRRLNMSPEPLTLEKLHAELMHVEDSFYNITGRKISKIWRAPYGSINNLILKMAAKFGYQKHIFWSNNGERSLDIPDYISKRLINVNGQLKPNPHYLTSSDALKMLFDWELKNPHGMNGVITLMHLGTTRKVDKLIYILPEFIKKMKEKGYQFVTVSEVLNESQD